MPTIAQLTADIRATDNASKTLDSVGSKIDSMGKQTQLFGSASDSAYNKAGAALLGYGGLVTGTLAAASLPAISFDTAKIQLEAFAGFTEDAADRVGDAIIDLASRSKFGTSDVSQAAVELAKAGFSEQEILEGGLQGTIDLAAAADMAVTDAASSVARNAKTWRGSIEQIGAWDSETSGVKGQEDMLETMTAMSDMSARAAADSTMDFKDINDAYVDMTGNMLSAGQDYSTGLTMLMAGAQRGLVGSEAGNSMNMLLANMSDKRADWEAAGIQVLDEAGNYRDMLDIVEQIDSITSGMSEGARDEYLSQLTDVRGARILKAALDYDDVTGKSLKDQEAELVDIGAAARMADKQTEGFAGTYEELGGAIEAARTEVGTDYQENLMPSIERMTGLVQDFTSAYQGLTDEQQKAIVGGIGMSGTIAGMAGTALLAVPKLREIQSAIQGAAGGSGMLAGAAKMLPGLLMGMGVAAGVGIVGLAAYRSNFLGFADLIDGKVVPGVESAINGVKGFNSQFGKLASLIKNGRVARGGTELAGWLEGAGYAADVLTNGVIDLTGPLNAAANAVDAFGSTWQWANDVGMNPAEAALTALGSAVGALGIPSFAQDLIKAGKAAGHFGDGVEAAVKNGFNPLASIMGGVANMADEMGWEELEKRARSAQNALEGFGQGFENAIISGLNPLSAILGGAAGGADALGMNELADNLRSFGAEIQGVVDSILPSIQQLGSGVFDALGGGIRRIGNFLGEVGGLDVSGMGDVVSQAATDAQAWLGEQATNIQATVTSTIDLVVNAVAGAISFTGDIVSQIGTGLRNWLEGVVSGGAAGSQPGGPRDVSSPSLGSMPTLQLAIEALKVGVTMVGTPIIEGAENIKTQLWQAITTKVGELFGSGGQLAGTGTDLTGTGSGQLGSAFNNIQVTVGNIAATLTGVGEVLLEGAENVKTEIWNAIKAKLGELFGTGAAQSSDGQIYSDAQVGALGEAINTISVTVGNITASLVGLGQVIIENGEEIKTTIWNAVQSKVQELMGTLATAGENAGGYLQEAGAAAQEFIINFPLDQIKVNISSAISAAGVTIGNAAEVLGNIMQAIAEAIKNLFTGGGGATGELSNSMAAGSGGYMQQATGGLSGGIPVDLSGMSVPVTITGMPNLVPGAPEAPDAEWLMNAVSGLVSNFATSLEGAALSSQTEEGQAQVEAAGKGLGKSIAATLAVAGIGGAIAVGFMEGLLESQGSLGYAAGTAGGNTVNMMAWAATAIGDLINGSMGSMDASATEEAQAAAGEAGYRMGQQVGSTVGPTFAAEFMRGFITSVALGPLKGVEGGDKIAAAALLALQAGPLGQFMRTGQYLDDSKQDIQGIADTWDQPIDVSGMPWAVDIPETRKVEPAALEVAPQEVTLPEGETAMDYVRPSWDTPVTVGADVEIEPTGAELADRVKDIPSVTSTEPVTVTAPITVEAEATPAVDVSGMGKMGNDLLMQEAAAQAASESTRGQSLTALGIGGANMYPPALPETPIRALPNVGQTGQAAPGAQSGAAQQILSQAQADAAAITAAGQQGAQMVAAAYQQAMAAIQAAASGGAGAGGTTPVMGPGGAQAPVATPATTAAPMMGPGGAGSTPAATGAAPAGGGGSGLAASVTAEFQAVVQAAQQGGQQAAQAVQQAATQIGTALSTAATEVSAAAQEIVAALQSIPAAVTAAASEAAAAAASIGPGIAAGIRSGIAEVEAAAGEMAAAATTPVVQKVDPGSPSKWGIGIGQTIPQGIALGIEQKSPLVQQAAEKLGYEAEQGLQPLLDGISTTGQAAANALGVDMEEALAGQVMSMEGWDPKSQIDHEALLAFKGAAVRMEKYGKRNGDEAAKMAGEAFGGLAENMSAVLMGNGELSVDAAHDALKAYRKLDADAKSKLPDDLKEQLKATYDEANITIGDVIKQRMDASGMGDIKGRLESAKGMLASGKERILKGMMGMQTLEQKAAMAAEDGLGLAIDSIKEGLMQGGQDAQSAIKGAVGQMGQGAAGGMGGPGEAAKQQMLSGGMGTGDGSMEDLAWGICECVAGANQEMLGSMGLGGVGGQVGGALGMLGHDLSGAIGGTGQDFSKAMYDYAKANPVEGHNADWMAGAPSVAEEAGCISICKEAADQMGTAAGGAAGSAMGAAMPGAPAKPDMSALGKSAGAEMASQTAQQCTSLCNGTADDMAGAMGGAVEDGLAQQAMDEVEIGNSKQLGTDIRKGLGAPMGALGAGMEELGAGMDTGGLAADAMGEETTDECCSGMTGAADDMASGTSDLGGQIEELANSQVESKMAETMKGIEEGLSGGAAGGAGEVPELIKQLNPNIERALSFDIADTNPHAAALMGGGSGSAPSMPWLPAGAAGMYGGGTPATTGLEGAWIDPRHAANPNVALGSMMAMAARGITIGGNELSGSSTLSEIQAYKRSMAAQEMKQQQQAPVASLADLRTVLGPPQEKEQEININLKTQLDGKTIADSTVKYMASGLGDAMNNSRGTSSTMRTSRGR